MQKPKPTNATGVSVHLTAYGPDGNPIQIGATTTDTNGKYGLTWTPSAEGTYHITATFEGTDSYFSSEDTTYLAIGPAASAVTSPTVTITPTTSTPTPAFTTTPTVSQFSPIVSPQAESATVLYVGIAAVIIIGAITAVAIFLRKRK